jgi:hypothetical protein
MVIDRMAELRQRGRTPHQQAQQPQSLVAREHAHGGHVVDMADLVHAPVLVTRYGRT